MQDYLIWSLIYIEAYEQLWNYTDTYIDHLSNGIAYGATPTGNGPRGFCEYALEQCGTEVYYTAASGVTFFTIQQIIDIGDLCLFTYANPGERIGHAIVPQGYVVASDNHGTASEYFVLVADGWHDRPRYLHYNTAKFSRTDIARFEGISPF